MALNPKAEPGPSNPYIVLSFSKYRIPVRQTCQHACLAGKIATRLAKRDQVDTECATKPGRAISATVSTTNNRTHSLPCPTEVRYIEMPTLQL
ncbi:Uncharacterized protein HZ326_28300 [Fusarium oxysporum f. sp. albedinis]|nr:Uncharacterized protein HZ326_28300 [Fusarium oxysporum f. sp. albedinis]